MQARTIEPGSVCDGRLAKGRFYALRRDNYSKQPSLALPHHWSKKSADVIYHKQISSRRKMQPNRIMNKFSILKDYFWRCLKWYSRCEKHLVELIFYFSGRYTYSNVLPEFIKITKFIKINKTGKFREETYRNTLVFIFVDLLYFRRKFHFIFGHQRCTRKTTDFIKR